MAWGCGFGRALASLRAWKEGCAGALVTGGAASLGACCCRDLGRKAFWETSACCWGTTLRNSSFWLKPERLFKYGLLSFSANEFCTATDFCAGALLASALSIW